MADDDRWAVEMPIVKSVTEGQSLEIADVALWAATRLELDGGITLQEQKNTAEKLRASLENQAQTIATLRADLAKAVEGRDAMRQQGHGEGFAAAIQQLRDMSAQKPINALTAPAAVLANSLEQSRSVAQSLIKELQ